MGPLYTPAVEISFLNSQEQALLLDTIDSEQATPSLSQAQRMKKLSGEGKLTDDILMATGIVVPTGKWVETTHKGRAVGNWSVKGQRNAKMRSKSFPGIARAMAEQWGGNT